MFHRTHLALLALLALAPGVQAQEAPRLYVSSLSLDLPAGKWDTPSALRYYCAPQFAGIDLNGTIGSKADQPSPLHVCDNLRMITHEGSRLAVIYVSLQDAGICPDTLKPDLLVTVQEHVRSTALTAGLKALVSAFAKKDAGGPSLPQVCETEVDYTFTRLRATADVTTSLKSAPDTQATAVLVTGPTEHWFLSGDAVVKGVHELKYDPDKKAVFERDKPEQLYLGVNYMWGDVYDRYNRLSPNRLVGKFLLSPTRHPFDSYGVAIAYRFADGVVADSGITATGGFMVFGGSFWTKDDSTDASGNLASGHHRSQSWRLGVSYSLDSLIDWLK